ncbi:MAG: hypothetical protein D6816_01805 [Bacteroidetes bacterium]|nr:MAG: hypothetical protein D6816_01805 [Bacteroidota bacterium]
MTNVTNVTNVTGVTGVTDETDETDEMSVPTELLVLKTALSRDFLRQPTPMAIGDNLQPT